MIPVSLTFTGRRFSSEELTLMRQAAADYTGLGITEIARTICEWLDWKRPNGRLKHHECRLLLERLRDQGVLALPPVRRSGRRGPRITALTQASEAQPLIQSTLADLEPLSFRRVERPDHAVFRQFIERYHYLGYRVPVGAHLRYFVQSGDGRLLACLQWSSPAWTMAERDRWIGWNPTQRGRNLQYIVNNSRFLILPWVQVKGLASSILARAARQVRLDWHQHFMATVRCCWKPWWTRPDSTALAIAPPTGSVWGKRRVADEWIVTTRLWRQLGNAALDPHLEVLLILESTSRRKADFRLGFSSSAFRKTFSALVGSPCCK